MHAMEAQNLPIVFYVNSNVGPSTQELSKMFLSNRNEYKAPLLSNPSTKM